MRLFLAIQLSPAVREALLTAQADLRARGFCLEGRPFQPHIALVRRWRGEAPQVTVPHASMVVRRISLLRSDLTDGKRIYTELSHISLR